VATDLSLNLTLTGQGTLTGAGGLGPALENFVAGQGSFGTLGFKFGFGTGSTLGLANQWYAARRTGLASLGNDDLDLSGGLVNGIGESVVLTAIKLFLVAIVNPDGIKQLRCGPNGLAGAFQGPFSGVAAGAYLTVDHWCPVIYHPWAGYALVGGATDKIRINNPSAVAVDYNVLAVGKA
jgi:hypothetical protein